MASIVPLQLPAAANQALQCPKGGEFLASIFPEVSPHTNQTLL